MKWVVLEFHFRWHQPRVQLVSLNTFCLNKPCSWKWFQNSLFLVAVPLLLFLKLFSRQYHKCMSMTDSEILLEVLHMNRVGSRFGVWILIQYRRFNSVPLFCKLTTCLCGLGISPFKGLTQQSPLTKQVN